MHQCTNQVRANCLLPTLRDCSKAFILHYDVCKHLFVLRNYPFLSNFDKNFHCIFIQVSKELLAVVF